jgi:hypothetical protein
MAKTTGIARLSTTTHKPVSGPQVGQDIAEQLRSVRGLTGHVFSTGTLYRSNGTAEIRPTRLMIAPPDGQASTEPVLEYSSS